VFENRLPRRYSDRRLEELQNLYSLPSIIRTVNSRKKRLAGHLPGMGQKQKACRLLGEPEGKKSLERSRRRWMDNINMDLGEIGWRGMDWSYLAQDRDQWRALVNTIINLRVLYNAGKFLSSCTIGDFSRMGQLNGVSLVSQRQTYLQPYPYHYRCQIKWDYKIPLSILRPPLWSSSQSSCLQIQRLGFDSRRYQIF
jgi:hypothetical protein